MCFSSYPGLIMTEPGLPVRSLAISDFRMTSELKRLAER